MYIHVHEFMYLYVRCTYMCIDVKTCLDIVQTRLCSFTTTLHFPSGPISLVTQASLSSAHEPLLLSSIPVFSTYRPPRHCLPRPNCHSHWFTTYALLLHRPSAAAVSQLPIGNPDLLCWLYW